jgi:hypothetical protein
MRCSYALMVILPDRSTRRRPNDDCENLNEQVTLTSTHEHYGKRTPCINPFGGYWPQRLQRSLPSKTQHHLEINKSRYRLVLPLCQQSRYIPFTDSILTLAFMFPCHRHTVYLVVPFLTASTQSSSFPHRLKFDVPTSHIH